MNRREELIEKLHQVDTANCQEPIALDSRPPFVRAYYERIVDTVIAFLTERGQKPTEIEK
jgi:hypothetical protein